MNDPNQKKNNSDLDYLIIGANWGALVVMVLSVGLLFFVAKQMFSKESTNNAPNEILIKYELKVDTVSLNIKGIAINSESVKQIDQNNKVVLDEINKSVQAQYTRMESILQVQEDRNKMFTYGAGLLAILVAIATFFGFKSINEMKKSTIDSAEYESKRVAEEEARKIAKETSITVSKDEISKQVESIKNDLEITFQSFLISENKKEVESSLNTKTKEVEKLKTVVDDLIARLQVMLNRNMEINHTSQAVFNAPTSDNPDSDNEKSESKNNEEGKDEIDFK